MKKNRKKAVVPYEDMAAAQDRRAMLEDLKKICQLEKRIVGKRVVLNETAVDMINAMVAQGEALRRIAKRDQITFPFFEPIQESLPWGDNAKEAFEIAKKRIAIASLFPGGIKDLKELGPDARKQVFLQLGLPMNSDRGSDSAVGITDPFTKFLNNILAFKQDFLKSERIRPLDQMSRLQLEDFISDTQWLADQRDRARRLLDVQKA